MSNVINFLKMYEMRERMDSIKNEERTHTLNSNNSASSDALGRYGFFSTQKRDNDNTPLSIAFEDEDGTIDESSKVTVDPQAEESKKTRKDRWQATNTVDATYNKWANIAVASMVVEHAENEINSIHGMNA